MERLILPPKFLVELRMLPETKLDQSTALVERCLGHYSGVDIILKSRHHSDVCRVQLTQNLPGFIPDMAAELSFAMTKSLIHCSSRVATANALRPYPCLLRHLLRPILAPKSRMDAILSKALEILGPAIQERQNADHKRNDLLGFLISTSEVVDPKEVILKLLVLHSAAVCGPFHSNHDIPSPS
ncbi:hypothetical protein OCU04_009307 [Sclerotinia nivalis]|uniref:Uncharacterized protein n=1 Tax=Sclerotinia nivalis TaxID=352851 RepID=A0A9X0AEY3_9HELO|nr:hypothetical protein OCU04_009307 [Sclerotinia nivalis]